MRRAHLPLTLLVLTILALPASALAAPRITFKPTDLPIPGFPGTGLILGAGAALRTQYTISGSEVAPGVPSQLRRIAVYLPTGTHLHPAGFKPCTVEKLEMIGPSACPKSSVASSIGKATVAAPIGGETIVEPATVQAFVSPGGGLDFYNVGTSPISATVIATGAFHPSGPGYGPELVVDVPPVPSVPGAPNASTTAIDVVVGSAIKIGHKTHYFGTNAPTCPKGGWKWKTELTFESGETSVAYTRSRCPKR